MNQPFLSFFPSKTVNDMTWQKRHRFICSLGASHFPLEPARQGQCQRFIDSCAALTPPPSRIQWFIWKREKKLWLIYYGFMKIYSLSLIIEILFFEIITHARTANSSYFMFLHHIGRSLIWGTYVWTVISLSSKSNSSLVWSSLHLHKNTLLTSDSPTIRRPYILFLGFSLSAQCG